MEDCRKPPEILDVAEAAQWRGILHLPQRPQHQFQPAWPSRLNCSSAIALSDIDHTRVHWRRPLHAAELPLRIITLSAEKDVMTPPLGMSGLTSLPIEFGS